MRRPECTSSRVGWDAEVRGLFELVRGGHRPLRCYLYALAAWYQCKTRHYVSTRAHGRRVMCDNSPLNQLQTLTLAHCA